MTTATYSRASATAFVDELQKIAAAKKSKGKLTKWLKNSALVAAGTGLGTGAYMVGERAIDRKFGKRWSSLPPTTRRGVAGMGATVATVGGMLLANKLMKERAKADHE